MNLVPVPAGEFWMGENANDKFANDTERPRHRVTVSAFRLGAFPVTVAEFREFRPDHPDPGAPDWPVTLVSWDDAAAYCAWRGGRLPTEAEWEYAARAGSPTPYPHGEILAPADANYLYSEHAEKVGPGHRTPQGTYPPSAFGLHDLLGNVAEWCADPWRPRYDAPAEPDRRVLRGGAWDYLPRLLRVSWRDSLPPSARRDNVGFRLAADSSNETGLTRFTGFTGKP